MNHRMGDRIVTELPVTVYAVDHGPITGELVNLSLSGAGIRCRCDLFEVYSVVELHLLLYGVGSTEEVRIEGFVVRKQNGLIGVMFMRDRVLLVRRLREEFETTLQRDREDVNASRAFF